MTVTNQQARNAMRSALEFWGKTIKTQKMAFDNLDTGDVAPVILKRTYEDPDSVQKVYVAGLFMVSDDEAMIDKFLEMLQTTLSAKATKRLPDPPSS
jgi:hypothetical protein